MLHILRIVCFVLAVFTFQEIKMPSFAAEMEGGHEHKKSKIEEKAPQKEPFSEDLFIQNALKDPWIFKSRDHWNELYFMGHV
ncbi:MAG: hypothetical protein JSS34_02560, partial [Proteobacteria bacterium]|nr:hypothetical protein [Pseudomonadota bacterium]